MLRVSFVIRSTEVHPEFFHLLPSSSFLYRTTNNYWQFKKAFLQLIISIYTHWTFYICFLKSRYCKCWEYPLWYDPLRFILSFSICYHHLLFFTELQTTTGSLKRLFFNWSFQFTHIEHFTFAFWNPGIVSAESILCETIHWDSSWVFPSATIIFFSLQNYKQLLAV